MVVSNNASCTSPKAIHALGLKRHTESDEAAEVSIQIYRQIQVAAQCRWNRRPADEGMLGKANNKSQTANRKNGGDRECRVERGDFANCGVEKSSLLFAVFFLYFVFQPEDLMMKGCLEKQTAKIKQQTEKAE